MWTSIAYLPKYVSSYFKFKRSISKEDPLQIKKVFPILHEALDDNDFVDPQYLIQDLFVAQQILKYNPKRHLDIASRIEGLVTNVATFRKIDVLDIRPFTLPIKNINFIKADLMDFPEHLEAKFDSISSLHAIEHFGLGRYGDPLDSKGHLKALKNYLAY